ncbi:MAG: aminopeptidase N [Alphaproteobacteria bacterium]
MKTESPQTVYLKDYRPYSRGIRHVDLHFDLNDGITTVRSKIQFMAGGKETTPLFLNGEDLDLQSIAINGAALEPSAYTTDDKGLTLHTPPAGEFTLETSVTIQPEKNTRLEGLYMSGGNYCTQCEAEGFRRVTFFPDRPDVLTTFTVHIEADKAKFPVLLSNGNLVEQKSEGARHSATWHDPFPKPCYLFALVAGNLAHIHDTYTTKSGRNVDLYIYVRHGDEGQCDHAMESLKKSMKWDEDVYGLEYDLNIFNIVAVSDFNMGAMENKSLNIFNTALVLAQQETATDGDFMSVESVIAHEYFHNWSGNRVTCRDWFQLSLKEGLTVFRDQEFSSDLHSRTVQRIDDVSHLRRLQFTEDAGPLAHPIRPDNYIEINNFYTMTVYEKGAEVIRMMRTILGPENYRKGTDLYFSRHDGQAVTCDDFVSCMQEASGIDLSQFKLWYEQAGTPEITFKGTYDEKTKTYTAHLSQDIPNTPGQTNKKPMLIPVALGLLSQNGDDMMEPSVLRLTDKNQNFTFKNIPSKPVPSVLRNFSAPVKLKTDLSDDDLSFLMVHDSDGFNRWESGQSYMLRVLNRTMESGNAKDEKFLTTYNDLLDRALDPRSDKALMARALSIPGISQIAQEQKIIDPQTIYDAREKILNTVVDHFSGKLERLYNENRTDDNFSITAAAMGKRTLQNTALHLLSNRKTEGDATRAQLHYDSANNMTDRMAALSLACALPGESPILSDFYARYKSYPLVIDKWFSARAMAVRPDIIDVLKSLRQHPDFNIRNPNRVRSLYSAFAMSNPVSFHAADGRGYDFLTDGITQLNTINPQIAARLLTPMRDWKRYTQDRQEKMKACLRRILETPKLSPDVFEIADKSLRA